ncbi:N-acetylglucosamine-6-phosphate deacetylase [Paenibacillus silviterrae]|uniref:N-acetylglucosamine-6-phosphate deacetylase n=1 Tax=Paenibacillus silviterrae TaxID=3242194 RepID=UPI00254302C8|nr:amidohydrolase family protein [Paenibacillus chinjuensis]
MVNGLISRLEPFAPEPDEALPWIAPGIVDLQINGYGGRDFNAPPLQEEAIHQMSQALRKEGVTSYYPTIITNGSSVIEASLKVLAKAIRSGNKDSESIAGIHLEGPFISPEDGPRGAHPREHVIAPDWDLFQRWQEAAEGHIRIITLSPEWPGSSAFIAKCSASGVTVSIGHTAAAAGQIEEAAAAGASMSTHLGNGAHLTLPRHPNYIWDQLAEERLSACFIADGFHLPDSVLKVILKVKGDRAMLVSDAVSFSGMPPGTYTHHIGGKVVLTPEGKLHMQEQPGLLAGSVKLPAYQIAYLVRRGLCTLPQAWDLASVAPSRFMGLPTQEGLRVGAQADLAIFDWDGRELQIRQAFKKGQPALG